MAEFIEKECIGYLSKSEKSGWSTKVSVMEVDGKTYYDIRKVKENDDPSKRVFGKGVSLSIDEFKNLYGILNEFFKE